MSEVVSVLFEEEEIDKLHQMGLVEFKTNMDTGYMKPVISGLADRLQAIEDDLKGTVKAEVNVQEDYGD